MSFWSQQAKFKALKEKKVSKKTQNSFMTAYHALRNRNDEMNKTKVVEDVPTTESPAPITEEN